MSSTNHYAKLDYRKLIAWDKRLAREWTFLEKPFASAPSRRVLDLGCGTGEHARFFAEKGYEVVGVDVSEAMLGRAREGVVPPGVTYIEADLAHVERSVTGPFGAAVCLGNTLTHITDRQTLVDLLKGVRSVLLPGAPFVVQILNYERLVHAGQRCLPLTFVTDDEGDAIFLRVMTHKPDGGVVFTPTLLRYRPEAEPAIEVVTSHNVSLHGWTRADLEAALGAAGFSAQEVHGTMGDTAYEAHESPDLVIVAR